MLELVDRIPVFVLDVATEKDHVIFCSPKSFERSNLFINLGKDKRGFDRIVRVKIPVCIVPPAGYIVSHHGGRLPSMIPVPRETVEEVKVASLTKRMLDRAMTDAVGNPYRRRSLEWAPKRSRLSNVSF